MADETPRSDTPDIPDALPAPTADVAVGSERPKPFWTRLDSPFTAGFMLTLGGLIAFVLGSAVANLSTIIIYVVFALFIALGLDPIVRLLESKGVKRAWGIVIVFFGFAVVVLGILALIVPTVISQITQFIKDLPGLVSDFMKSDLFHRLESVFGDGLGTLVTDVQNFLTNPSNLATIGGGALQVGVSIATGISGVIIVLVLTLYFIASLPTMKKAWLQLLPARNRPRVSGMTDEITESVGGYLIGMVILAFFNSVFATILHLVLGLPFPALMGVVAFLITLIPLIGSVLYWGTASVIALFTSPLSALIFAIAYLIYMQVEAYVLTPKVMNRAIQVPGALVVIGALVGGTLLGLLGALVAIPVTASILLIIKQVWVPRQDAKV